MLSFRMIDFPSQEYWDAHEITYFQNENYQHTVNILEVRFIFRSGAVESSVEDLLSEPVRVCELLALLIMSRLIRNRIQSHPRVKNMFCPESHSSIPAFERMGAATKKLTT